MKVIDTPIPGLRVIEPKVHTDDRGFFMETYQDRRYKEAGIVDDFVQDNRSFSTKGVLRGFHYCFGPSQSKLVFVSSGEAYVVAADIRKRSPTFSQCWGLELSEDNNRQIYLATGLASSFLVTGEYASVHYKVSSIYDPLIEGGVRWNDPVLGVDWPGTSPILNPRDAEFPMLCDIPDDRLPHFEILN